MGVACVAAGSATGMEQMLHLTSDSVLTACLERMLSTIELLGSSCKEVIRHEAGPSLVSEVKPAALANSTPQARHLAWLSRLVMCQLGGTQAKRTR